MREALWVLGGLRPGNYGTAMSAIQRAEPEAVLDEAAAQLTLLVALAWTHGWQPAELARHARRKSTAVGDIVTAAIAADHLGRDRRTMHPRWAAQADPLASAATADDWIRSVIEPAGWLPDVLTALRLCADARTLPTILPPPGSDPAAWDGNHQREAADDPVLAKVRALLAQAESTTFDAEAETFTAKAQELMARHAIDSALVWSRSEQRSRPITIRIPIDDPYAEQKALLLHVVAEHSQCRMVTHGDLGLHSVVGFAADVAATELLFTSLLVQSQAAMQAEAAGAPPGTRVRSRSFRSSFLAAYAQRIGQRLAEINRAVREDAEAEAEQDGPSLLPVLAARRDAIDEEIDAVFGELRRSPVRRGSDWLGVDRGRLAADRAELNPSVAQAAPSPQDSRRRPIGIGPQTLF